VVNQVDRGGIPTGGSVVREEFLGEDTAVLYNKKNVLPLVGEGGGIRPDEDKS